MRLTRSTARLLILLLLCAGIALPQTPARPEPSARPSPATRDAGERTLLIIADNQEHSLTGVPLRSMGLLSEYFASTVAIRPALAHVGGRLLMREALRFGRRQGAGLFLHLGDAADISCPGELSAVFDVLDREAVDERGNRMWFMAPGNHDGILAGTHVQYQPRLDEVRSQKALDEALRRERVYRHAPRRGLGHYARGWPAACLSPKPAEGEDYDKMQVRGMLTRGDAIRLYVERLKKRPVALPPKTWSESESVANVSVDCTVERITLKDYEYEAVAKICQPKLTNQAKQTWVGPYASYIVQKLVVAGTTIVLLDTSNYTNPTTKNVGFHGGITEEQWNRAESFFPAPVDRERLIIAAHHPLSVLPREWQERIIKKAGRYISAHVHRSTQLVDYKSGVLGTTELNIGSTLDYPPQAVVATMSPSEMHFRVAGADVKQTKWDGFLAECEKNRGAWRLPPRFYKDYKHGVYTVHLLDSLVEAAAVHRVRVAPTSLPLEIPIGNGPGDWERLAEVLREINSYDGVSGTYWACQSYYASEATRGEWSVTGVAERLFGWAAKSGRPAVGERLQFKAP